MPLSVFEDYYIDGIDGGYSQEVWDKIMEEYEEITGDAGALETRMHIGTYTEISHKTQCVINLMSAMAEFYNIGIYYKTAAPILTKYFPGLSFSLETLKEDIPKALTRIKGWEKQAKDLEEYFPKEEDGEGAAKKTFFDDILRAHSVIHGYHTPKQSLSVQEFALIYKSVVDHIDRQKVKKHHHHGD